MFTLLQCRERYKKEWLEAVKEAKLCYTGNTRKKRDILETMVSSFGLAVTNLIVSKFLPYTSSTNRQEALTSFYRNFDMNAIYQKTVQPCVGICTSKSARIASRPSRNLSLVPLIGTLAIDDGRVNGQFVNVGGE